jgi:hypothetical protein
MRALALMTGQYATVSEGIVIGMIHSDWLSPSIPLTYGLSYIVSLAVFERRSRWSLPYRLCHLAWTGAGARSGKHPASLQRQGTIREVLAYE